MKVLVCGTSIALPESWGQKTWVHYLEKRLGCELVNLSRVGAGNQYIHDAVMCEVVERDYDLVIVSWSSFTSVLEVRSNIKQKIFDWDIIGGNPHEQLLQTDWIWDHVPDHAIPGENNLQLKKDFFKTYLRMGQADRIVNIRSTLLNVLSLQSTLKCLDIPYMFTFPRKVLKLKEHSRYHDMIDWSRVDGHNLYTHARNSEHWQNRHPTEPVYRWYADQVYEYLSTKNLIVP
jgi:hypothetical protein